MQRKQPFLLARETYSAARSEEKRLFSQASNGGTRFCLDEKNMFSPGAVIMKPLRRVKIEFCIFYRDLTVFPEENEPNE